MYFGNFLDIKGDFLDTVHFPPIAKAYPFRGWGVYRITGKITEEFDCINIEVESMEKMPIVEDTRYADPGTPNRKGAYTYEKDYQKPKPA